ncbi:MAG: hypothetical protein Q8P90_00210 [bacterium]|nr:hypothetical protein [bacterium]
MSNILFDYKKTAQVQSKKLNATAKQLEKYSTRLQKIAEAKDYSTNEASLQLPFDTNNLKEVKSLAKKVSSKKLKQVVVIGIGGSNLGTIAIYEAIYSKLDHLDSKRLPKLLFLDTVSSLKMQHVVQSVNELKTAQEFLVVAISKSGGTAETIANLEVVWAQLGKKFKSVKKRTVFITDFESKLWKKAEEEKIYKLQIPKMVGGRYSVFSSVGLLPLYLAGINIDKLLKGARTAIDNCTSLDLKQNQALVSAILTVTHSKKKINIHNTFLFNPELESTGKWYRQLMGESVGKEHDLSGKTIRAGITPIVSIGSTDLHSMAQLYFGGPKDKFTNIVYYSSGPSVKVESLALAGLVNGIKGKSFSKIMQAIIGGVTVAYKRATI